MAASKTAGTSGNRSIALGAVIYEALILAVAMKMRGSRRSRPRVPAIDWSEAQIAIDVVLLKLRLFEDFLTSHRTKSDDMVASDFHIAYAPSGSLKLPKKVREAINKRMAHLSWARVGEEPPVPFTEVGEGIDVYAERVLKEVYKFITSAIEAGISPSRDTHKGYWDALKTLYAELVSASSESASRGGT